MLRVNRRISVLLLAALILSACLPLVAPKWLSPSLQLIGHVSGTALAVAVQGNYAYLGFSYEWVVLDITDRSNPQWITSLPIPTNDIALVGDYAYVVGRDGFTVVDINDPTQPQVRGHLTSKETAPSVVVAEGDAYFVEDRRLHQVDIADPTQPRIKRTLTLPSRAEQLTAADGYLYLSSYSGVHVLAISEQEQPSEVCFIETNAATSSVVVTNDYAYFVKGEMLQMLDVSTPTDCHLLTQIELSGWINDLTVVNGIAYLANGNNGLSVWDITEAEMPASLGAYATGGIALVVAVQDSYLYLADCNEGLFIYTIDDPTHLMAVGRFTPLGITANLTVVDAYAYMTAGTPLNLHRIDVTDPARVHTIQNHLTAVSVYGLAATDQQLYLLTPIDLQIIDVSTPTKLRTISIYPIADPATQNLWFIAANRAYVYLGDNIGNVWIINLAEPPQLITTPIYTALGNGAGRRLCLLALQRSWRAHPRSGRQWYINPGGSLCHDRG